MKHEHHRLQLFSDVHSNGCCCSVFQHTHNVENISVLTTEVLDGAREVQRLSQYRDCDCSC